jgi:hypothetical protein
VGRRSYRLSSAIPSLGRAAASREALAADQEGDLAADRQAVPGAEVEGRVRPAAVRAALVPAQVGLVVSQGLLMASARLSVVTCASGELHLQSGVNSRDDTSVGASCPVREITPCLEATPSIFAGTPSSTISAGAA